MCVCVYVCVHGRPVLVVVSALAVTISIKNFISVPVIICSQTHKINYNFRENPECQSYDQKSQFKIKNCVVTSRYSDIYIYHYIIFNYI